MRPIRPSHPYPVHSTFKASSDPVKCEHRFLTQSKPVRIARSIWFAVHPVPF